MAGELFFQIFTPVIWSVLNLRCNPEPLKQHTPFAGEDLHLAAAAADGLLALISGIQSTAGDTSWQRWSTRSFPLTVARGFAEPWAREQGESTTIEAGGHVNVFINHLVNEISPREGAVRALRRLLESDVATRHVLKVGLRAAVSFLSEGLVCLCWSTAMVSRRRCLF